MDRYQIALVNKGRGRFKDLTAKKGSKNATNAIPELLKNACLPSKSWK